MSFILEFRLYNGPRALPIPKKGPWRRVNKSFGSRTAAAAAAGQMTAHHRDLADVRVRKLQARAKRRGS